jgi:hypothetical protein
MIKAVLEKKKIESRFVEENGRILGLGIFYNHNQSLTLEFHISPVHLSLLVTLN